MLFRAVNEVLLVRVGFTTPQLRRCITEDENISIKVTKREERLYLSLGIFRNLTKNNE